MFGLIERGIAPVPGSRSVKRSALQMNPREGDERGFSEAALHPPQPSTFARCLPHGRAYQVPRFPPEILDVSVPVLCEIVERILP